MAYSQDDLRSAEDAGVIGKAELDRLLAYLSERGAPLTPKEGVQAPKFDAAHLLWYAGALIVIGAMGLFSTLAFSQMGGWALCATAVVYATLFTLAGHYLWHGKNLRTPGGLLVAIAVTMAPLAVFGIQDASGWWSHFGKPGSTRDFYVWIKGGWLFMELAAIGVGILALRFYRFPFIVSIIAVALWFMSMDLAPWIFDRPYPDWEMRRQVSV